MYSYDPKKEIIEVDDFFPKYTQKQIANIFTDYEVDWKHLPSLTYKEKNDFDSSWTTDQIQEAYGFAAPITKKSNVYSTVTRAVTLSLKNFLNIDVTEFLRIMVVIIPCDPSYQDRKYLTPHIDMHDKLPYKNLLYYVNDNDAETIFFNQKYDKNIPIDYKNQEIIHRIKPKQGSAAIWDGSIIHAGSVSRINKRYTLNILFK